MRMMNRLSHAAKQFGQAAPQPFGNLFDVDQRQVPNAALNPAVVGPVKVASLCSLFLADSLPFAQTADGTAKADANVERHSPLFSWLVVHSYTADESHIFETLFAISEPKCHLAIVANSQVHDNAALFTKSEQEGNSSRCLRLLDV